MGGIPEVARWEMHLIHFPNRKEHERAIGALLAVPFEYTVIPGPCFVVRDEHIKALEVAKVRFEYPSRTAPDAKQPMDVQS
jgi:hypothetical protein